MNISVKSKLIKSVDYVPETRVLTVRLRNGQINSHRDVPQDMLDEFASANSQGLYYLMHIKNFHPATVTHSLRQRIIHCLTPRQWYRG